MNKVFLCHSSHDKEYVRVVARHLGRARVVFDEVNFKPGKDFIGEINRCLELSCLIVIIISKDSLNSVWCKYEINKAQLLELQGKLEGHLAVIIDRNVAYKNLPKWLQYSKTVIQTRPSQTTRDIQHLFFSYPRRSYKTFCGTT